MSLIEKLRSTITPKAGEPLAPRIEAQLSQAKQSLVALQAQYGNVALAAATGENGSAEALAAYHAQVADAKVEIANLTAAYDAAVARDTEAANARVASLRETQVKSIREKLRLYTKSIVQLQTSIENMENAWRDALRFGDDARLTADAAGLSWPIWATIGSFGKFKRMVGYELWRQGSGPQGEHSNYALALPGAAYDTGLAVEGYDTGNGNASKATPILDMLTKERDMLLAHLSGTPLPAAEPVAEPKAPAARDPRDGVPWPPVSTASEPDHIPLDTYTIEDVDSQLELAVLFDSKSAWAVVEKYAADKLTTGTIPANKLAQVFNELGRIVSAGPVASEGVEK